MPCNFIGLFERFLYIFILLLMVHLVVVRYVFGDKVILVLVRTHTRMHAHTQLHLEGKQMYTQIQPLEQN